MLHFETESFLLNEGQGGDALAAQTDMITAFDGVSSSHTKGSDTKDDLLSILDKGLSLEESIRTVIQQQRHDTTLAIARLTPSHQLEIYRIGDSRVRVHDEQGKLVYETTDQNLFTEVKHQLGLVKGFFERPQDEVMKDILEYPEVRSRFVNICNQYFIEGEGSIFSGTGTRYILQFLDASEMIEECRHETGKWGYSPTLLKIIFSHSKDILSYSLSVPESMAFCKPVKILDPRPGYRVVVGTDGIFANLRDDTINTVMQQKSLRLAVRGLIVEASRRNKTKRDMGNTIGKITAG